ncbi:class I SAM-dependent methyltransferase [bacterium]|nr:class I SAM-dependent methyltransferase [candidate division CSSED10-310 bacterium]
MVKECEFPHGGAWYRRTFGAYYSTVYCHRDESTAREEVMALVRHLGLPSGAVLLDAACGAGRHLRVLLDLGYDAWGVDLSAELLQEALNRPGVSGRLIRGDLRELPLNAGFDSVFSLFSSFGYFHDEAENQAVLEEFHRVLLPRGWLVLDHMNRELVEMNLVPCDECLTDAGLLRQTRWICGDRVEKEILLRRAGGDVRLFESVRMYHPRELIAMAAGAGFTGVELKGDFAGVPFAADSPRMILSARRCE